MKSYKNLSAKECALRILEIENPAVAIHQRPDGDAVGSGAALCEIFRQLGKDASIICADPIPERLRFILDSTGVSTAENGAQRNVVAIDVASPSQLGALAESISPVLMIDHHEIGTPFADGYIVPKASSAAEALLEVALVLADMNKIELNKSLAYSLFAAISSDTGCFAYSNAEAKTHIYAAKLIDLGIDAADINHRLFSSKSKEQIKAEGFVASKIETDCTGYIAYAALTLDELNSLGLKQENFETAIDVIRALQGVEIAFFLRETESGKYKASLRSTNKNVAAVAKIFGGGGHVRAAGCSLTANNVDEAKAMLLGEIIKAQN